MPLLHRYTVALAAISFLTWSTLGEAKKDNKTPICPIGFNLAYTHYEKPICYKLKDEEAFEDIFEDCAGNLYTSELYHSLNLTRATSELWSGHRSLYPGGPFIDWSFSSTIGKVLTSTYDVKYNLTTQGLDEELCVVIHPIYNFTAVRCTEKHHRYCMVEPYEDSLSKCEELTDYYRFWSPKATCLAPVTVKVGKVRANWLTAQKLCAKRNGALLHRGWRYANNPLLHANKTNWTDPLGIETTSGDELRWVTDEDGNNMVPLSEWGFEAEDFMPNNSLVALKDGAWQLVNSSYIFMDVICERSIHLRNVSLNLTVEGDQVILRVNDSVDESNIHCFTDAIVYSPTTISKITLDDNKYSLKTKSDGTYWCVHRDSRNFRVSESNKVLFIRENSVENLYAIKIKLRRNYRFENIDKIYRIWEKKVKEYIYYRTKYIQRFGDINTTDRYEAESILQEYKSKTGNDSGEGSFKDGDVIYLVKIKRLFLDGRTVLLHVQLNPMMRPVPPGYWEELEVVYMKPAYFCSGGSLVATKRVPLGQSVITAGCRKHTCLGDFNEGVQFVITQADNCTIRAPVTVTKTAEVGVFMPTIAPITKTTVQPNELDKPVDHGPTTTDSTPCSESTEPTTIVTVPDSTETTESFEVSTANTPEVTTVNSPWPPKPPITIGPPTIAPPTTEKPTTTIPESPALPEEKLQQVLEDLDALVNNDTISVMVEDVSDAVDRVDAILDIEDELDIPGHLLQLVDALAARVDLNGSHQAQAVANNIAMLMADATPENPVKGLRIAAQNSDRVFSPGDFEIIAEAINSTHLTDESEAVVHLPESVSNSSRRISFVVFRTDRAFGSGHGLYSVNSRVLSIKIEDLTEFDDGEVIDIHLRPLADQPERNQTRTCAYWHFLNDSSGFWSQQGCTFIPSSEPGQLDTCRCDHLTHFAEILVPKTVFSEENERALEIISIIGCVLSLLGLVSVGITAAMFRSWRRDFSNKIWLQLCIAILILIVCFLVIVFAHFEQYDVTCLLVGVLLHYSVLASFCWMLVAAVLSYRRLVLVFTRDASHKLLRASAFSWGAPCAVVGILLSADPHAYAGQFEEMSPSSSFCYPSGLGLWLTVYAPLALMLLANWTLFVLIVRSVFASRRIQRHGDSNEALRCASVSCLLVFLFGLPWIFGLFAYNVVAAYFFTLTATFQGFVLFIFFVVGNKKTRDLWLNKLKIKQTQKIPVTSSTYTNNKSQNSASEWRGGRSTPATIEANASKPRSLTSPDDSRFS